MWAFGAHSKEQRGSPSADGEALPRQVSSRHAEVEGTVETAARITAEHSDGVFPPAFAEPTVISVFTMCLCKVLRNSEAADALALC